MNEKTLRSAARILASRAGKKGGRARALSLSKARRSEIARAAALARWSSPRPRQGGKP
jgi:hypothetical protein